MYHLHVGQPGACVCVCGGGGYFIHVVYSQEEITHRVELEYRLFLSIDSSLYRPKTIFSEGVQNFVHWHFFKSNMAAATAKYH